MALRESLGNLVDGLARAREHQAAIRDDSAATAGNLGEAAAAAEKLHGSPPGGVGNKLEHRAVGGSKALFDQGPDGKLWLYDANDRPLRPVLGDIPQGGPVPGVPSDLRSRSAGDSVGSSAGAQPSAAPSLGNPGTIWTDPETGKSYLLDGSGRPIGYTSPGGFRIGQGPGPVGPAPPAGIAPVSGSGAGGGAGGLPPLGPPGTIWTDPETGKSYLLDANGRPIGMAPRGLLSSGGSAPSSPSSGQGRSTPAPSLGNPGTIWTDPETGKSYELDANGRPIGYVAKGLLRLGSYSETSSGGGVQPSRAVEPPTPFPTQRIAGRPGLGDPFPDPYHPASAAAMSKPVVDGLDTLGKKLVTALDRLANSDAGLFSHRGLG